MTNVSNAGEQMNQEEEFQAYCLEAISCLRKKAEKEEMIRKKQDDNIMHAIERYANTLTKGLRNSCATDIPTRSTELYSTT